MRPTPKRLGHKKSRNGCVQCKARHVKCDEQRPCQACVRFNVSCSLTSEPNRDAAKHTSPRNRSQSLVAPRLLVSDQPSPSRSPRGDPAEDQSWRSPTAWLQSLQLLHHYDTVVSDVLSHERSTSQVWKDLVPKMAFSHESLMHGLLAVSALHYAQHHPGQRKEYILISSHYQNLALKIFAVKLQDINEENIEPYFYLATFIFILSLCSIAERQDSPSPVTPSEIAQSFMLLQGAKSIYEFKSTEIWSRDGPLAPLVEQDQPQALPAKQTGAFHDRMDQLYALARGLSPTLDAINEKSSCLLAIESLRTIHSSCSTDRSPSRARRIWLWPISLTHIFLELLSSSHYVALIILAHYAALAKPFENKHWMNQDWSANVMASVERTLEDKWQEWIAWPKRSIEQEINVDEMSP